MNNVNYLKSAFVILTLAVIVLTNGCNGIELTGSWRDRDVQIDGMQFDWENALFNLSDEKVNIGILNDDDYLYVCLVPLDETIIRQAMRQGFTVWLEAKGDKAKKLGIRYPIGMMDGGLPPREPDQGFNPEEMMAKAEESLNEFQIIGADKKDTISLSVDNESGVQVRVGTRNERMVYELKIPLNRSDDHPYAVGVSPGDEIKIKFETGQFKRPEMNRPRGERPDGRMPSGGMPGGGRGMRPDSGMRPEMPQPMKLDVKVKLAKSNSEAN